MFGDFAASVFTFSRTLPEDKTYTCLHETCALFVHQLPDALQRVVAACDGLPKAIRAGILAIVV
jgi:hypothetical protein